MAKAKEQNPAGGMTHDHEIEESESAEDAPLEQEGDSNVSMNEGSVAAGEAVGGDLPDAVPGMELEISRHREMAVPPAGALPSASEFEASMAVARELAPTTFVPAAYRGKPAEVLAAIFTGRELGIGPMQSLRDIDMIEGRPAFRASLQLSQMRRGGVEILDSEVTDERAWIRAKRHDTGEVAEVEWRYEEAENIFRKGKALADGDNWKNYRQDMLWARCVGRLARRLGSDLLAGMVYAAEELRDLEGWDTDGYNAGAAPPPPKWEEIDPGERMHPDTPKGWKQIMEWLEYVDPTVDWALVLKTIFQQRYKVESVRDLGDHTVEAGRRSGNLAGYLRLSVQEGREFPPPAEEEVVRAIAWAFEGLTFDTIPAKQEVVEPEPGSDAALSPEQVAEMEAALDAEAAEIAFGDDPA